MLGMLESGFIVPSIEKKVAATGRGIPLTCHFNLETYLFLHVHG
jgi:hypothetical protein